MTSPASSMSTCRVTALRVRASNSDMTKLLLRTFSAATLGHGCRRQSEHENRVPATRPLDVRRQRDRYARAPARSANTHGHGDILSSSDLVRDWEPLRRRGQTVLPEQLASSHVIRVHVA